jgi:hypothetical protein
MGEVVQLREFLTDLNSDQGRQWVTDCTRAGEDHRASCNLVLGVAADDGAGLVH